MPNERNLNGRVVTSVIDFDLIVNTDIGLIKFIQGNFQDDKVFDLDKLNRSDRTILSLLYSRNNPNPLSVITNPNMLNEIDSLYKSFFESYKQEIIDNAIIFSDIFNFVSLAISSRTDVGINAIIAVNDSIEEEEIYKHFNRPVFLNKSDKLILSREVFYINDYRFFDRYNKNKIVHKKIYITPLQYSLDYIDKDETRFATQNQFILFGKDFRNLKGDNTNGNS